MMYRIMIVDDEPIEREALKLLIKNHFGSLLVASEAQNGFEAIELSRKTAPDLIIMDIKMPGLNGIEAVREIKRTHPDLKFIILSSYNEFEYAQCALKLDAEDFIVKPAKMRVMVDSIRAMIEKLESEQNRKKDQSLLQNRIDSIKPLVENDMVLSIVEGGRNGEWMKLQEFLDIDFKAAFCIAVSGESCSDFMVSRAKKVLTDIGVRSIGGTVNGLMILFIPYEKDDQEQYAAELSSYLKKCLDWNNLKKVTLGIGCRYSDIKGFRHSYLEAVEALRAAKELHRDCIHIGKLVSSMPERDIHVAEWEKRLLEEMLSGDPDMVLGLVNHFLNQLFAGSGDDLTFAKDKAYQVMVLLDNSISEMFGNPKARRGFSSILEEINGLADLKGLRCWFVSRIQQYLVAVNDGRNSVNVNSIVRNALDYIGKRFSESITLDDVAEKLNISPFYLSKILKKHTGRNYTDLVVEMRIQKAKELLSGSEYSIKEVTHMTGFNSQNYFAKIFRKMVGATPTEYKNSIGERKREDHA